MSWDDAYNIVIGEKPPEDSVDLRNSYIEGVLADIDGKPVRQHDFHREIQGTLFRWMHQGVHDGIISAPYGGGKSQQVPIGLASYLATRAPEKPHIIISADPDLAKNRIASLRQIFESDQYRYWCREYNFNPVKYSKRDTNSSQTIILDSRNRTGVPTFFAAGIETKGTGWRCFYLWGDDICNNEDFKSKATRDNRHKAWTNTWSKRILDGGCEYLIRTPYHVNDANERLIKTGIYAHLEIAVNKEKTGYTLTEWKGEEVVRTAELPLWEVNHSPAKLNKEEAKDYSAYQLGFRMLKEVQDPSKGVYKFFSDSQYPVGNIMDVEFDWASKKPLELTCDFNRSPHCWAFCQQQNIFGRDVYAFIDEIVSDDALTEEQALKAVRWIQKNGHNHVDLYGDGTGNQGGTRYGRSGDNDWGTVTRVLKENGVSFKKYVKKSNPLRAERIKQVNNVIYSVKSGEEVRRMVVNPRCKHIIDDYKYAPVNERGEKKRDEVRGHISDACDYRIYAGENKRTYSLLIK